MAVASARRADKYPIQRLLEHARKAPDKIWLVQPAGDSVRRRLSNSFQRDRPESGLACLPPLPSETRAVNQAAMRRTSSNASAQVKSWQAPSASGWLRQIASGRVSAQWRRRRSGRQFFRLRS